MSDGQISLPKRIEETAKFESMVIRTKSPSFRGSFFLKENVLPAMASASANALARGGGHFG